MINKLITIKNKVPDLFYAYTDNGVELPVLDITHPLFTSSINENKLKEMLKEIELNGEKNSNKFQKMPTFIKRFLVKRSFIMADLLPNNKSKTFVSGMSTLMLKLGPGLIGKGKNRFFDRLASQSFGGMVLRMRVRDLSKCQAEVIISLLKKTPKKNICFVNIAGGAACDSINTLILIQKENPSLLKNRKIEINVLDIDSFSPNFAEHCITALKTDKGYFHDLDISFRYVQYNWNSTEKLIELLNERKQWLYICSSEGGIFEYCSDEIIIQHLNSLYKNTSENTIIAGSILHDSNKVDPGIRLSLKISTNIKPRLLGIDGLKNIAKKAKWKIGNIRENNPRYIVFTLMK